GFVKLDFLGLGVDAADRFAADIREPGVVLRVGDHVVDIVPDGGSLERLPRFPLAGLEVHAMHAGEAVVLRPHLAVDGDVERARHVDLRVGPVPLGRYRPHLQLLGPGIELADGGLVHHADPQVLVAVHAYRQRAERRALLQLRRRDLAQLAGFLVELADDLRAEVRVPDRALRVDHHVVRLYRPARQIPFRDDDARRAALGPGEALQLVRPRSRGSALIDGGGELGGRPVPRRRAP